MAPILGHILRDLLVRDEVPSDALHPVDVLQPAIDIRGHGSPLTFPWVRVAAPSSIPPDDKTMHLFLVDPVIGNGHETTARMCLGDSSE